MSGRKTSSEMAVGWYSRASASASAPVIATEDLEALVAGEIAEDARVVRIVFDDEQHGVALHRGCGDRLRCAASCSATTAAGEEDGACGNCAPCRSFRLDEGGSGGADVGLRQVEREGAALAGVAAQLDFAAEQVGQFAADGQAETGAAVLAAGARIGLLEGLEDDALFFRRDADAGIGDLEGDHRTGAGEDGMIGAPAAGCARRR